MTIYQLRDHRYDKLHGGRNSLTHTLDIETSEPTHKISSQKFSHSLESTDLNSLDDTIINEKSLTFCVKAGEDPNRSINLYGIGLESFEDTLKSISGVKHIATASDKKKQPKIVFSANCKEAGTIFGKIQLVNWENNTKITSSELWAVFTGIPREHILEKYDQIYTNFGLDSPSTVEESEITHTSIDISHPLQKSGHWKSNRIYRKNGVEATILKTDMIDPNDLEYTSDIPFDRLCEETPQIFSTKRQKRVDHPVPENQEFYTDIRILHNVAGETFYQ